MQQSDHFPTPKQPITFAALTLFGVVALLLGLALIIFAHYHERAYVFLGLGAGGFIGGIAGIVGAGSKVKVAVSYGMIALGIMGMIVGLNYLISRYGPSPNQAHGDIVIALSIVAITAGIREALIAQPEDGMHAIASVIMLGVIASLGLVMLIFGTIYLVVLQSLGHAYFLLGTGAMCLLGGIIYGIFAQSRARAPSL